MNHTSSLDVSGFDSALPAPPRFSWVVLAIGYLAAGALIYLLPHGALRDVLSNVFIAAWPISTSMWIRRIDNQSQSLYWALASFATGFLFSWLLWIVVVFQLREELLEHYNTEEPVGLRLNFWLSAFFSFVYFQYKLNEISRQKGKLAEQVGA